MSQIDPTPSDAWTPTPPTNAPGLDAPRPERAPDPGSPARARLAGWLVLLLIGVVALVQQLGESAISHAGKGEPGSPAKTIAPPDTQTELAARMMVRLFDFMPTPEMGTTIETNLAPASDKASQSGARALRRAIVLGELDRAAAKGPEPKGARAIEALGALELASDDPLREDADTLVSLYKGGTIDDAARQRLIRHHGYFGELAGVYNAKEDDPQRERITGGGGVLLLLFVVLGLAILGAGISGLVLLVMYLVKRSAGTWQDRFVPPAPGGSLAIETVLVFVLGFLALKGVSSAAEHLVGPERAVWIAIGCQWLLLLALLWPVVMGVRARTGLRLLGLHKGEGVAREMACGLVGYLACLPIMFAGALLSLALMLMWQLVRRLMGLSDPAPPENPIIDIVAGSRGTLLIVVFYLLASLWAPIAEETIFRGGLFRHLRTRWGVLPSALVTGLGFGLMHGYPLLMLGGVISIGFGFSLMRQWRDSIIAPMTAHCLHNATVLALLLVLMNLLW